MVFNFFRSVETQSVMGFPLYHFIDEIGSFNRPFIWCCWDITFLNLNLFWQNVVSDFLPWFAFVRPLTKHALKCHYSDCEVINGSCMVLAAHDLWSHIAWRSRCILCILRSPNSCNTKISNSQISIVINDKILWFDISMYDILFMTVFEASHQASYEKSYTK